MEPPAIRLARVAAALALAISVLAGTPARALPPPALHWELMPGPGPSDISVSGDSATGPIQGAATNATVPGLLHDGMVEVNYGVIRGRTKTVIDAATMLGIGPFCAPAPCSAFKGSWSDTLTLTDPNVANGSTGSFAPQLVVSGSLDAFVPTGWASYLGTFVNASWGASVFVDGQVRDVLAVNCTGGAGMPCSFSTARNYYPPGGGFQASPLPSPFGTFVLGPYDFIWGQPFDIEVRLGGGTSVNRGINQTGMPSALSALPNAMHWGGLAGVFYEGSGAGGEVPLGELTVSSASGVDWFPAPEPNGAAAALAALLALAILKPPALRARAGRSELSRHAIWAAALALLAALPATAVVFSWAPVEDAGNPPDPRGG